MKTVKKGVLAALFIAVMAFALCACGSKNVDGTYVVTKMAGTDITAALEMAKAAGNEMTAEQLSKVVISGSSITISAYQEEDRTGTIKVDGDNITCTFGSATVTGTIVDKTLTLSESGVDLVYEKK